jgi:tetratricopeptide (TPR) repeat protein
LIKKIAILCILSVLYVLVLIPFTSDLKNRPIEAKLGYLPEASIIRITTGEYRNLMADIAIMKVLFYFGTLNDVYSSNVIMVKPDYFNMFKIMEIAALLDPYNMDVYYFSQAAFTWEIGHAADVNKLLEYGMKYRTWDYQLPFYAGFNAAYFMKDYKKAAMYMKKAAELSGNQLFIQLASRYFYEAGRSDIGIAFLETMSREAKDMKLKKIYETRRDAMLAVKTITEAIQEYKKKFGSLPNDLKQLVSTGFIREIPSDPYGGIFYIDQDGMVRSTSKFVFTK